MDYPITGLKSIETVGDTARVGGYLVVWGDENHRDLEGEFFTPETEFYEGYFDTRPMLFHHGKFEGLGSIQIGSIVKLVKDNVGIWAEAILDLRKAYVRKVAELIDRGVLNWSSGTLPNTVKVARNGQITHWAIVEGSATPTPAEPRRTDIRMLTKAVKSIGDFNREEYIRAKDGLEASLLSGAGESGAEQSDSTNDGLTDDDPTEQQLITMINDLFEQHINGTQNQDSDNPIEQTATGEAGDQNENTEDLNEQAEKPTMELDHIINAVVSSLGLEVSEDQLGVVRQQVTDMLAQNGGTENVPTRMMEDEELRQKTVDTIKSALTPEQPSSQPSVLDSALALLTTTAQAMNNPTPVSGSSALQPAPTQQSQPALVPRQQSAPAPTTGFGGGSKATNYQGSRGSIPNLQLRTKYHDMTAQDMAYMWTVKRAMAHGNYTPSVEFMREMADKATKSYNAGKMVMGHSGIKAVNAIKSDELSYTSQTLFGEEYVPDLWLAEVWQTERRENVVAPLLSIIEMPSNPYELPIEGIDPEMYAVPETTDADQLAYTSANPTPMSKTGTDKKQITAKKLALRLAISEELEEDAIIPMMAEQRRKALIVVNNTLDFVFLNADADASNNINDDGGSPGATSRFRYGGGDGLLRIPLKTNTALAFPAGGPPTLMQMRKIRFALANAYTTQISNLAYIVDVQAYSGMLNMKEFVTMDKAGPLATAQTGQLGFVDGIPVYVSAEIKPSASNGYVNNDSALNQFGRIACVYIPSNKVGYRRRVTVRQEPVPFADALHLSVSVRVGQTRLDDVCVSLLYAVQG